MVFRSLSEDDVHTFRDLPTARSTETHRSIGCEGGILHLDSCDVTMSIPPRTVQAGTCHDVSLALVTDDPPPIREGEFLTGHGIGITFPAQWRYSKNQPMTLSLPHAASLLKSNDVHSEIIWKQTESNSVHRTWPFDDRSTQCFIKEREINLIIDATSVIKEKVQLWTPIELHYHASGKRMMCTPFLPIDMAQREDITLRVYIHEDIPYIVQKIQEEEENLLYRQVHPGRCFVLEPESSDIVLECIGEKKIISAKELFNRQKKLVSMPITTETNARMQMVKISISATSTNQPNTSMSFVAIRTGFSTDILSPLDEMVPGSNTDLSNTEDTPSYEFITKEINTDQYYHLGLALGLSYQTLDSIQFRSRQHDKTEVNTPNQKAAIVMICYWKGSLHSVSLADDHLREVWMSVSDSGDLTPVLEQGRKAEKPETDSTDVFEEGVLPEESRTAPTVGLHALGSEIIQGQWEGRVYEGRTRTPSVRSDSVSSLSTVLDDEHRVSLHGEAVGHVTTREFRRTNRPDGSRTHGDYFGFRQQSIPEDHDYQDWQLAMSASKTNTQQEADPTEQAIASPCIETGSEFEFPPICRKGDDSKATGVDEQLQALHTLSPDKYHSEGIFDQTGGELHIPSYGLTLSVPPGALPEGSSETITVDVLTDIPPEITLRHDETLVTYGFQCLPSGLQFVPDKPVILKMPHSANLIDPTKVQVVLYSMNHEGEADRIVQTSRTCRVTYSHVEILLEHFSKGFLVFRNAKYKRMSFMPFLPKTMPQCRKMLLEFRMVTKPAGIHWRDVHEIREKAEFQPAKDDDDDMNVKHKNMEVTCQLSDNGTLKENIDASSIKMTKHTLYFELDFNGKEDNLLVKLKVKQSKSSMDIKFRTRNLVSCGITETSIGGTVSTSTSVTTPVQGASAAAGESSTSRDSDAVSDGKLTILAAHVPHNKYHDLSDKLGIEHNLATNFLEKHHSDYKKATRECFSDWKNKTGGSFTELESIFYSVKLGGIWMKLMRQI